MRGVQMQDPVPLLCCGTLDRLSVFTDVDGVSAVAWLGFVLHADDGSAGRGRFC